MSRPELHPLQPILEQLAPALHAAAEHGRNAQARLNVSPWALEHFTTTAVASSIGGYARWRVCAEHLVSHTELLPKGVVVDSSLAEHRGGQYRLTGEDMSFAVTVKHRPHKEGEEPDRIKGILEQAPVGSDSWIVTLQVNAPGAGPTSVQVCARGRKQADCTFLLTELMAAGPAEGIEGGPFDTVQIEALDSEDRAIPEPEVFSDDDARQDEDGDVERRDDEEPGPAEAK